MADNWLIAMIISLLIAAFKNEISNMWTAWRVYDLRAFDADGNPSTSDIVQILCGATGVWIDVIIEKYVFSFSTKKRGVYLIYPDGGREKIGFLVWSTIRKRNPPVISASNPLPPGEE